MIVDSTHKKWCVFTLILCVISTVLYILYVRASPNGPSGGSWPGLAFGVAGSFLILFAGALSVRKRIRRREAGSAQSWLRAHIWMGLLSVPLILFHAGFRFGGLLEQILMLVFGLIIVSGIIGLGLQNFLPRFMQTSLPSSTMVEQIPAIGCMAVGHVLRHGAGLWRIPTRPESVSVDVYAIVDTERHVTPAERAMLSSLMSSNLLVDVNNSAHPKTSS